MPTYDLKKAAASVTGDKRVLFGFYIGATAHHLGISAVWADVLKNLETSSGGRAKPDFRGVCFHDNEKNILVFGTKAKPTTTRETMITKVLRAVQYGGTIELRQLGPDEPDGSEPIVTPPVQAVATENAAGSATPTAQPTVPSAKPGGTEAKPPSTPTPEIATTAKRARELVSSLPPHPSWTKVGEMIDTAVASNDLPHLKGILEKVEAFAAKRSTEEAEERANDEAARLTAEMRSLVERAATALKKLPLPAETKAKLSGHIRSAFEDKDRDQLMGIIDRFEAAVLKEEAKGTADKAATDKAAADKAEKEAADRAAAEKASKEAADKAAAEKAAAEKEAANRVAAEKAAAEKAAAEKAEREAAEKAAAEKAEREAAEKAVAEKAAKEAAESAAAEKAEREAAERAAAEREATERAQREATQREATERAQREATERAQREATERAAEIERVAAVEREAERVATAEREATNRAATAEQAAVTEGAAAERATAERETARRAPAENAAPTGNHREAAATLTRALSEDELNTLGSLPPALATSVVNILKTVESDLASAKSIGEVDREVAAAKLALKQARADLDEANSANAIAIQEQKDHAPGKPGRNQKKYEDAGKKIDTTYDESQAAFDRMTAAQEKIAGADAEKRIPRVDALLRGALRFGAAFKPPVDPDTVEGLSPAQKDARRVQAAARQNALATVLSHFKDQPELAATALDLIPDAAHPEVIAAAIPKVGELRAGKFAGKASHSYIASEMATNALKMAGAIGGDFNERLTAYYNSAAPKAADAWRDPQGKAKKTTLKYTAGLADAMLGADGKIQTNPAALGAIRDNLHFHPDSLRNPMFNLARHLEKFRADLGTPEIKNACDNSLATITANPPQVMIPLVRATLGVTASTPVNALAGKKAVLSAALTPLTQGQAGSCFATCNCMDYQENKPDKFFGDLCELVRTGKLTKGDLTVPIAKNIAADENKLLRGLEYTVASLGASRADSGRKRELSNNARRALAGLVDSAAFKNVTPELANLNRAIINAATAAETARLAHNGHNANREAKRLQWEAATGAKKDTLFSEIGVMDAATPGLRADYDEKKRVSDDLAAQAPNASTAMLGVLAEATRTALAFEYDSTMTLPNAGTAADGNSSAGGWQLKSAATGEAIADLDGLKRCLTAKFAASLPPGSNQAHIATLVGSATFLDGLRNEYTHSDPPDNLKPTGSIFKHVTGGSLEESKQVLAGKNTETAPIVPAPAEGMSEADKTKALLVGLVDATKGLDGKEAVFTVAGVHGERALPTHPSLDALKAGGTVAENADAVFAQTQVRATTPLAPEEIQLFVDKSVREVLVPFVGGRSMELDLSAEPFTGGLSPVALRRALISAIPDALISETYSNRSADAEKARKAGLKRQIDSLLMRDLFPQFVVADTNWGSVNSKMVHVVSADLKTGEPKLFSKDQATGELTAEGEGFVDAEWRKTTTKD